MVEAQRHTALLWAPVALGLGVAWYFGLKVEPVQGAAWAAAGCGGLSVLAVLTLRRATLLALLGLVFMGFGMAKLHSDRLAAPVLTTDRYGPVVGRIVGFDRSQTNKLRLLLDRVHLPGVDPADTPRRVRVVLGGPTPQDALRAGARVMTIARLGPPPPPVEPTGFDFRRHAWFLQLGAIGYTATPVVLAEPPETAQGVPLLRLRLRLAEAIRSNMPTRTGGFAAAILTGDRSGIDPRDLVDLRASNLAHLLAISGLHMGLLTGVVFMLTRFGLALVPGVALRSPAKRIAALAALLAGAAYLALSGASIATQRAFIMAAVIFIAVLVDRPALTLRAVAVAALLVLLWRPESLLSAGFQMSFAATIALVAVYQGLTRLRARLPEVHPVVRWGAALVLTSLVAGLATAPYSAFHFNQLTRFGLVANVLAVPAMGLLVMPSALVALVLAPLGLDWIGYGLMDLGIAHILRVAHWVAGLDGAVLPVAAGPGWVLGLLSFGGLVVVLMRGAIRLTGVVMVAMALVAWGGAPRPLLLVNAEGSLVGVDSPGGRILNRSRGAGFAARVWLENDGDAADQATAGGRPTDWRDKQAFRATLHESQIQVHWSNADNAPLPDCRQETIIIAPKRTSKPAGPCQFLGASALAANGAHAFYPDALTQPLTTHDVTGRRPWTHPNDTWRRSNQ